MIFCTCKQLLLFLTSTFRYNMVHQRPLNKPQHNVLAERQQQGLELNVLLLLQQQLFFFSSFSHTDVESQLLAVEFQEGLQTPSYCSRHIHRSTHTYIPGRCESKEAFWPKEHSWAIVVCLSHVLVPEVLLLSRTAHQRLDSNRNYSSLMCVPIKHNPQKDQLDMFFHTNVI